MSSKGIKEMTKDNEKNSKNKPIVSIEVDVYKALKEWCDRDGLVIRKQVNIAVVNHMKSKGVIE